MTDEAQLEEIREHLRRVVETTERQEEAIASLVKVTSDQSSMIDKMWQRVDPILKKEARKEDLKQEVLTKVLTGSIWAILVGLMLAAWKGFQLYVMGD